MAIYMNLQQQPVLSLALLVMSMGEVESLQDSLCKSESSQHDHD